MFLNKRFFLLIFFFIFVSVNINYSKTDSLNHPNKHRTGFIRTYTNLDVMFSYSLPMFDLGGNIQDFFDFKNYGVKYGYGTEIGLKLSLNKKGLMRLYFSTGYGVFFGSDLNKTYIDSNKLGTIYPLVQGPTYTNPVPGTSDMHIHILSASAGMEYDFINNSRWTPYLNADLNMNVIFGTYRQTPNYEIPPGPGGSSPGQTSFTINSALRFGLGAGAGFYYRMTQSFGLTFCTKFRFVNIFGKSSERSIEDLDLNKMNLLDKSSANLNPNLNKNRSIGYLGFYLGASFFISKIKK